jgi:hypothetical protein
MLKGLAFRLGFLLCMAVSVRLVAALFAPAHPEPNLVAVKDRFGNTYMLPARLVAAGGGEAVTSDRMRAAIDRIRGRGGAGANGSEARLVFGSGTSNPVVTTPSELAAARADLRRVERDIEAQTSRIEREELQEDRKQNAGISFEPGKPMIDPTPRS